MTKHYYLSMAWDDDGSFVAAYFRITNNRVAYTKEIWDGNGFADYDKNGKLIGLEVLTAKTFRHAISRLSSKGFVTKTRRR